jgi:uncharacterized protein YyaL (SSP411 family)
MEKFHEYNLNLAMKWLIRCQEVTGSEGLSAYYMPVLRKWAPPYPETTGYTIPTFYKFSKFINNKMGFREKALKMAEWLLDSQTPSGAFPSRTLANNNQEVKPAVFNTGQIILGLLSTFKETGNNKFLNSAIRAGNWLISQQSEDGTWNKAVYHDSLHSYNTRVAWALLELNKHTENEKFKESAILNLEWALSNQIDNGWFENAAFKNGHIPFTHTLAYTIRGLLESGLILNKKEYIKSAKKTADKFIELQRKDGALPGAFDNKWKGTYYSCIPGDAQISIVWLKLYSIYGEKYYLKAAKKINCFLKNIQIINAFDKNLIGGLPGSVPKWGRYMFLRYPNWSVKFFIDALILERKVNDEKF